MSMSKIKVIHRELCKEYRDPHTLMRYVGHRYYFDGASRRSLEDAINVSQVYV